MKSFCLGLLMCSSFCCIAQGDKSFTLKAATHANIVAGGLSTNEAGFGFSLAGSYRAQRRLHATVVFHADRFFGDKLLVIDPVTGAHAKGAASYQVLAGPEYYLTPRSIIALGAGPAWYRFRDFGYQGTFGWYLSVTTYLGAKERLFFKGSFNQLQTGGGSIQFVAIGFGLRLF